MKKLYSVLFMIFVIFGISAESYELTVREAVEMALENNPNVQNEAVNLQTLKRAKDFSFNDLLPSLNFQAMAIRNNRAMPNIEDIFEGLGSMTGPPGSPGSPAEPSPMREPTHWNAAFNLQAQWIFNPAQFVGIKNNVLSYQSGLLQYEDACMKVERDIKKMYHNIYLFEKTLGIFRENLATAEERYETSLISYNNGLLKELDLKQIRAAYEALKPTLIEQENQLEVILMNFKILLGIQQSDDLKLVYDIELLEDVPIFDTEELIDNYLTTRADIKKIEFDIDNLKYAKKAQLLGQLSPSLSLSAGYNPTGYIEKDVATEYRDRGMFSVGISIPLGNYIFATIPLKAAKDMDAKIKQLEIALTNYTMLAEFEIRKLDLELKKIKKSLEVEKINSSLAEDVYVETEKAYHDGNRVTYLELEETQSRYNQARISYLSEQINLLNTIVDLEYALNECISQINCEVKNEK